MVNAPIVLLHGLMGTLRLPEIASQLSPDAIAPDLLGYGQHGQITSSAISLDAQVAHVKAIITSAFDDRPVHLVGHSVGGVVAMLFAAAYPDRVSRIVSVEGNFTLNDAFWSASVARMTPTQAEQMLRGFRADLPAWLGRSGIAASPAALQVAERWLHHQPASTVRAMARSVVAVTGERTYLATLQTVFGAHPVHLLAGERSRPGWDVPAWAEAQCASSVVLPGTGHMMMLEDTAAFVTVVRDMLTGDVAPSPS